MYNLCIVIHIFFQYTLLSHGASNETLPCISILKYNFDKCTSRDGELKRFHYYNKNKLCSNNSMQVNNNNNNNNNNNTSKGVCLGNRICNRFFKIRRIQTQFSYRTMIQLSDLFERCCGSCVRCSLKHVHGVLPDVNISLLHSWDIVFPVIARSSLNELYGFHYIPVLEVPSAYLFSLSKSRKEKTMELLTLLYNMWPLFIICLFMSVSAGFVAWILESRSNTEQFPKAFHIGLFEGFWWAFVTMTTVGYGDKLPKCYAGRIFATVWILAGITLCSVITATVTNGLIDSSEQAPPDINGQLIGALNNRLQDATIVAQYGGILHETKFNSSVKGIVDLIRQLERKVIAGFIINKPNYYYFSRVINKAKYKEYSHILTRVNMIRTEMIFRKEKLVSGILVKNIDDYKYFKSYFENNWIQIQDCFEYSLNFKHKKFESRFYTPVQGLLRPFMFCSLGIFGFILVFGVLYEIMRKHIATRKLRIGEGKGRCDDNSKVILDMYDREFMIRPSTATRGDIRN